MNDNRFADYFAERLGRSYVGTEMGQFVVFRRDRFIDWLRQQLARNTPYDEMARQMISATGLWTDHPATNYVTAAIADGELDENKLAGRTVRAFLGQRIDCAQCHDHPFAEWKQAQFQGLASLFGQTQTSPVGLEDKAKKVYEVQDRKTLKKHVVEPAVPFHPEWLPKSGTRRARLAAWITHPDNRRFERATANRVWGLLFGKPYHSPVDDLPDPPDAQEKELLDLIGADFREHGYDLRRMIRVIVASRPFRRRFGSRRANPRDDKTAGPEVACREVGNENSHEDPDQGPYEFRRAIGVGQPRQPGRLGQLSDDSAAAGAVNRLDAAGGVAYGPSIRTRTCSCGRCVIFGRTTSSKNMATWGITSSTSGPARFLRPCCG